MITDQDLKEIYANAPVEKDYFQVIKLSAPWFSQDYYVQNTFVDGINVQLENSGGTVSAEYAPMVIGESSNNADMNYERSITIQSLNDIIADEISNRDPEANQNDVVTVEFRTYVMYRNGTVSGPRGAIPSTRVTKVSRNELGSSLTTSSKPINNVRTGEVVTLTRVPMLEGYL